MNKRVNVKAIVILTGCAVLLGAGVHFAHSFQVTRNAKGLSEQAALLEQEGKRGEAAAYLDQYLGMVPDDTDALARLGLLLDELAKTPRARLRPFFLLEQVLRRDGQRQDIRRRVAKIATEIGRFADAKTHLDLLLQANPQDAELMQWQARCAAGERRPDDAAEWYRKALKLAPERLELHVEYAGLLRARLEAPELADDRIAHMIFKNPDSPKARLEGARYFRRFGDLDQAEKHVRYAMDKLGVRDAEVFLLAADVARVKGKTAEARQYVEQGQKLHPKDTRLAQTQARLDLQDGDRKRASKALEECLKDLSGGPDQLWELAELFLQAGAVERAELLSKKLGEAGAVEAMHCLQAQLLMKREAWGEARRTLDKLRTTGHLAPVLKRQVPYLLALCYEHLDNPDQRLLSYQRAVDADPQWPAARRGLAQSLAALGKLDQALDQYRKAAAQAPQLRGELAQLLIARNRRLPLAERRWSEVEKLLKDMAPGAEQSPELLNLHVQLLAAQDQLPEARKLMEAERQRDPKQLAPWLFLAGLALRESKGEGVLPLVAEAEKQTGPQVEWSLVRLEYWVRTGGAAAPVQLRKLRDDLPRFPDADGNRLRAGLAEAFARLGDTAEAETLWRQLAERQPKNLALRVRLFERALRPDREAEARRLLAEIKGIEGEAGPLTAWGEAACLFLQTPKEGVTRLPEIRALLARAAELRPSWSRVPLLEAETYELEHRKDKALEKYQAALDRGEGRLRVVRRVLQLLYEQQRFTEAQNLVHKLPQQALAVRELGQMAALALLGKGEEGREGESRDEALHLARKAAKDNPKDYRDHLWLGQVAAAVGQMDEAEKAFRRARDLDDKQPTTWAALVLFLAPRDAKKAETELKAAQAKLTREQLPPVLAAGYEALGRLKEAEEQYLAMQAAKSEEAGPMVRTIGFYLRTGQAAKAEPWLRKVLDPQLKASEATAAWARRELALVLASRGLYPAFREALAILEANSKNGKESQEDRQAKALVLATQPAHRREAIGLLANLPRQGAAGSPVGQFLLAQLYERDGNWPQARATMVALLRDHAKTPTFVAGHIRSLLRHGDKDEAAVWAAKLAVLAPKSFETLELRVFVLKEQGKGKEAADLVQAYVREKDARLDLAALLLDRLGQSDEAEALLRSFVAASKQPAAVLVLAQHLSRRRLPEALSLCEDAWKTCPPEVVAFASVTILRSGKAKEEDNQRVERWLIAAMTKDPKSAVLPAAYAQLQDARGRYEEAIGLYRKVLDQSAQNIVALNNLAYLLAFKEGKGAEALALAQRAIDLAGPDPEMLDTRAVIAVNVGQADRAVQDLQQALAQAPTLTMYFHLAQAEHLANNRTAATASFRKATEGGLRVDALHPLERPAFQRLAAALNIP